MPANGWAFFSSQSVSQSIDFFTLPTVKHIHYYIIFLIDTGSAQSHGLCTGDVGISKVSQVRDSLLTKRYEGAKKETAKYPKFMGMLAITRHLWVMVVVSALQISGWRKRRVGVRSVRRTAQFTC